MTLVGGFSRRSPVFRRPYILALLHTHLASPSSALKTWLLRATQISLLTLLCNRNISEVRSSMTGGSTKLPAGLTLATSASVHLVRMLDVDDLDTQSMSIEYCLLARTPDVAPHTELYETTRRANSIRNVETNNRIHAQSSSSIVAASNQQTIDIHTIAHKTAESSLEDAKVTKFSGLYSSSKLRICYGLSMPLSAWTKLLSIHVTRADSLRCTLSLRSNDLPSLNAKEVSHFASLFVACEESWGLFPLLTGMSDGRAPRAARSLLSAEQWAVLTTATARSARLFFRGPPPLPCRAASGRVLPTPRRARHSAASSAHRRPLRCCQTYAGIRPARHRWHDTTLETKQPVKRKIGIDLTEYIANYNKAPVFSNTFIHFPRENVRLEDANGTTAYPAEGTRSSMWRVVACEFDSSLVTPVCENKYYRLFTCKPSPRGTHLRPRRVSCTLSGRAVQYRSYVCTGTYKPSPRGTLLGRRSGAAWTYCDAYDYDASTTSWCEAKEETRNVGVGVGENFRVGYLATPITAGMQGRKKREFPKKARRPAASSGTIPTCENSGVTRCRGLSSASSLTAQPPPALGVHQENPLPIGQTYENVRASTSIQRSGPASPRYNVVSLPAAAWRAAPHAHLIHRTPLHLSCRASPHLAISYPPIYRPSHMSTHPDENNACRRSPYSSSASRPRTREKWGMAVLGTQPFDLCEYVYVDALGRLGVFLRSRQRYTRSYGVLWTIDLELQCQTAPPDFIIGFSGLPPTVVANLNTYSPQNVVTCQEHVGTPISNQFLITFSPADGPANSSQSGTRPVTRSSCRQSEKEFAHI
ncbi:hypothetical protein PR048_009616 [Dryococelus australis]|uniref:Kringle domain-containing protein n=1 Tax=Dryococelus australis TaxID=614101 RepID=A0ABQ9I1C7_9NEOP|nr:hypothetical protein PR048_009616 [Dryococelus australis]